jgi:hypothetical protein
MKINKEKLHELYMKEVDLIFEVCDWKTYLSSEEIVNTIVNTLEKNPELISND